MMEPERYELQQPPVYRFELNRREWFEVLGGGLLVLVVTGRSEAQESGGARRAFRRPPLPQDVGAWLHIGEDSAVTVYTGKVEVGQNIRTSLAQAVAEELRAPIDSVRMVMGDTDLTPFDMGTFGSMSTPVMSPQLRRAGATAREALIGLAAKKWSVDRASLTVRDARVADGGGSHSASFGELTHGQKLVETIPAEPELTPAASWSVMGKPVRKVNARAMVTGEHKYPSDMTAPGMLFGKVVRPPAFGAKLQSVDDAAARKTPGVVVVHDGDFIGVAAPDPETAAKAAAAIHANWKTEPQPSNRDLFEYLKSNPLGDSERNYETGSVESALSSAEVKLRQAYNVAYIAHAPLEPRAALAQWSDDGRVTVWTGTQRPFGVRTELTQAFHLPDEKVRVMMPDTGSGYGGKHTGEAALEAARLAKAAGKPVKVVWTREDEFTWAYFRPAGVIEIASGAKRDGTVTAWDFHNYNSGAAGIRGKYDIANERVAFHPTKSPLRQGSYRALAATANHFARESHMDELAHAVGMDPLQFRIHNLKDERQKAVLQAAADKFGWGKTKAAEGRGFGIACGFDKNGYVATAAEVSVDRRSGKVKIERVVTAWDSGAVVNPDGLKNQVEGANIMGLGGALFEAIQFENGRILNNRFARYRVPRFSDVPAIDTVLMDRKDITPAGAGEISIVGLAPAVGNAIFAATGVRLRNLPMVPDGLREPAATSADAR
jgi:isoquinoline 1-oxidoreductase